MFTPKHKGRRKNRVTKPLITKADQQLVREFLVNSSQAENPVELRKLSANDTSYIYVWRFWNR
jgi:hypothetical protein